MSCYGRIAILGIVGGLVLGCWSSRRRFDWGLPDASPPARADAELPLDAPPEVPAAEPPAADLSGKWAMFFWEDPVAVELVQQGNRIGGVGCVAGLPEAGEEFDHSLCGRVEGTIEGATVRFTLVALPGGGQAPPPYSTDVTVSADGQRMGGLFSNGAGAGSELKAAWRRIGAADRYLVPERAPATELAAGEREGIVRLEPVGAAPPALTPIGAEGYWLELDVQRGGAWIRGTLGSFSPDELSWDEAAQTLSVGPVPVTALALPVALTLAFDGKSLMRAEATMPGGETFRFQPRPP